MNKPTIKPRTTCPDGSPHHWRISPATGGLSEGFCINDGCFAVRTFKNHLVDDWNGRTVATPRQAALMGRGSWQGYDRESGRLADEVTG